MENSLSEGEEARCQADCSFRASCFHSFAKQVGDVMKSEQFGSLNSCSPLINYVTLGSYLFLWASLSLSIKWG